MIDDERPLLEGLGRLLRREGYRVHLAADGPSGAAAALGIDRATLHRKLQQYGR